jgi:hypothetical protein
MLWSMLRPTFNSAPPPSSPDIVYMLRAILRVCDEYVASLWRARCDQHPNISVLGLCCELCCLCPTRQRLSDTSAPES